MDAAGVSRPHSPPVEPSAPRHAARYNRRRLVIVAIGTVFVLGGSYHAAKRTATASLSASCLAALRGEDWERLEGLAARWRRWEPRGATPSMYLAEAAIQRGRYARAVEWLDHLPDADPRTPPALLVRSSLLFGPINRPIEGAEVLERAVRLEPTLVEARRRLIYFYAFTLQRRKMVDHAYEAIRTGSDLPETYIYLMAQDWLSFANAYDENTKWLRGDPDEELFLVARTIYRITSRALDEDERIVEYEDRVPYHRKVVAEYFERFPQNLELLVYYLRTSSKNGDIEEVARFLSRAPPEAVDDNRFWRYKGWLHAARGELAEAETSYRKALELNPYDPVSQHQLAGVLRRLTRFDEVKVFEDLAREGKELQREILQLDNVLAAPPELMRRMAQYAKNCGDDIMADKLVQRLAERARAAAPPRP